MASRTRRKRGRDPKTGHVDSFYDRRLRFEVVLRPLGLAEAFGRLPRKFQELFWRFKMPDLVMEYESGVPGGAPGRALRKAVEDGVREATVEVEGAKLAVRNFLSVMGGMNVMLNVIAEQTDVVPVLKEFVDFALPRVRQGLTDYVKPSLLALYHAVIGPVVAHSRLDSKILTVHLENGSNARGKEQTRLVFRSTDAQSRRISLEGADRPAYRVGTSLSGGDVTWITWPGDRLGRWEAEYPVFVQSHALRQLAQRVNLPGVVPYLQAWMAESLENPTIVERRPGGTFLVEFRIQEHRVGYLVTKLVENVVVVRTFLFLTMESTPEARKLERRLKLTRRDLEWLGLNDLSAFTRSDLRDDAQLRTLLTDCGCGHLLDMEKDELATTPRPLAAELRQYVRLAA